MSTRCQIGFYEPDNDDLLKPDFLIYRHNDGYPQGPSGVIEALVPFLTLFHNRRGLDDTSYAAAWTLHHLIQRHVEWAQGWHKRNQGDSGVPADGLVCMSFGMCKDFHGDIAYYYAIRSAGDKERDADDRSPNYNLEVYKVDYDKSGECFSLQEKIEIKQTEDHTS